MNALMLFLMIALAANLTMAAPQRRPIFEPLSPPIASARANLFLNANCTASGHWSDRVAGLAVNGVRQPADHWACENLPVWHQVNLSEPTKLSAIHVWPYWGDGRVYQYKVEGSLDEKSWITLGDMTANSITASAEGALFEFAPTTLRHVRTTFLTNSRGSHTGGHLVEIEGYAESPSRGLSGGVGSTDIRYAPEGELEALKKPEEGIELVAWRGERVSAQVVISADSSQQGVRMDPLRLVGPTEIEGMASFIRYTLADGEPQGDIIDPVERLDIELGRNRPIWIEINVPSDALPGRYEGELTVRSNTSEIRFPIRLEVLVAQLPKPADWSMHLDLWQHPDAVARWHDVPMWSDAHFALLKPGMIRLAEAGQKTITTTLNHRPWGGQTYDGYESMIVWHKHVDGTWSYDYSAFDRWVTFASEECGLGHARIHGYSMLPWSLSFRYFDEASQAWMDQKLQPGTKAYDDFWGGFLEDFSKHLKKKGWHERMRIGMDERPDALMKGAMATLAKHAPDLQLASAINHPSEMTRTVDDISPIIQHVDGLTPAILSERRAADRRSTFYVCTSPPVPNTFTFSPPAESEWLPLFAAANGLDGFLRWAYHSWVENPLVSTDFTTWPSGDCFLVYPGDRTSIRFERLRDGIETFEKIRLLREMQAREPTDSGKAMLEELDAVFADFTWERGKHSGPHAGDVRRVNEAVLKAARAMTR